GGPVESIVLDVIEPNHCGPACNGDPCTHKGRGIADYPIVFHHAGWQLLTEASHAIQGSNEDSAATVSILVDRLFAIAPDDIALDARATTADKYASGGIVLND